MIRYAVDRSRPTRGGMLTSVVVHGLLLLLLGMALRQGPSLPIPADELTKITYVEAHQGEDLAEKIRLETMAKRRPTIAQGRGLSTRSAQKPKPKGEPGTPPEVQAPKRSSVADVTTPIPTPTRVRARELPTAPQLEAKARELASIEVDTPDARRRAAVEDASSATPRLEARAVPRSLDGAKPALEGRRAPLDLAGGDIDPAPRVSTGSRQGLADAGASGPGRATLESSRKGATYAPPSPGLTRTRGGGGIAEVGAADIAPPTGGGTDDGGGRRTILDYGSGRGGGLRGRGGGAGAIAPDRSALEPTRDHDPDVQSQIAEADGVDLRAQGMNMSISGQISGRKILDVVAPEYSQRAKKQGWEGVVAVHFTVLPDGRVKDNLFFEQTSAHRDLNRAAMAAIQKFRFAPLPDGDPQVEQWGVITFVFRLR